jgi:hypothetical protein
MTSYLACSMQRRISAIYKMVFFSSDGERLLDSSSDRSS